MAGSVLETLIVELKANDSELRREFEQIVRESKSGSDKVASHWQNVGAGMATVGTGMSLALTAPLMAVGVAGVRTASQLERVQASFETMTGSAATANKVLDELTKFGAETPFQFGELSSATTSLLAFGEGADTVVGTLRRIGDVASGVQAPIGDIAEVYGKARVQGTLFAEDINQLTGRGIPVTQEFSKQLGVSESAVKKLASEGKITFPMLEQAFISLTSEGGRFADMMERQSQTTGGKWSTFIDSANMLAMSFSEYLLPSLNSAMDTATKWIDKLGDMDDGQKKNVVTLALVAGATGPVITTIGKLISTGAQLKAFWMAHNAAMLPLLGPAGILLGVVGGLYAVYSAMDAGKAVRAEQKANFDALLGSMQDYRDGLTTTTEAERQAAENSLRIQKEKLLKFIEIQEAFIASLTKQVKSDEARPWFQRMFTGMAEDETWKWIQDGQDELKKLKDELSQTDTQLQTTIDLKGTLPTGAPTGDGGNVPLPTGTDGTSTSKASAESAKRTWRDVANETSAAVNAADRAAERYTKQADITAALQEKADAAARGYDELVRRMDVPEGVLKRYERLRDLTAEAARNATPVDMPMPQALAQVKDAVAVPLAEASADVADAVEIPTPEVSADVAPARQIIGDFFQEVGGREISIKATAEVAPLKDIPMPKASSETHLFANSEGVRYDPNTGFNATGQNLLFDQEGYDAQTELNAEAWQRVNDQFLQGLTDVMAQAANQLGAAVATGDFSSMSAGDIGGSLLNMATPLLTAIPGIGPLATIGVGLLSGYLSNLDGSSNAKSAAERDAERGNNVSSITMQFFFTQTNQFQGGMNRDENVRKLNDHSKNGANAILEQVPLKRLMNKAGYRTP